jgi:hypothetical protein
MSSLLWPASLVWRGVAHHQDPSHDDREPARGRYFEGSGALTLQSTLGLAPR